MATTKSQPSSSNSITLDPRKMPRHIAIIMDGNRRWAKQQGWMAIRGHTVGARTTSAIIRECSRLDIEALTLYTFSTENWKRPRAEVSALMRLITRNMKSELPDMMRSNIQVRHVGRRENLPEYLLRQMDESARLTQNNSGLVMSLALNYGGRAEIRDAFQKLAGEVAAGKLKPEDISEEKIAGQLYNPDLPEPDLMIRTGGEMRISNFLPWQIAYAELWVTPTLWPEFTVEDLHRAIYDFQHRDRRFGGVKD